MSVAMWTGTESLQCVDCSLSALAGNFCSKILAEIEKQRVEDRVRYIHDLNQTFRNATSITRYRTKCLERQSQTPTDFIDPNDRYLQSLASLIKASVSSVTECM